MSLFSDRFTLQGEQAFEAAYELELLDTYNLEAVDEFGFSDVSSNVADKRKMSID